MAKKKGNRRNSNHKIQNKNNKKKNFNQANNRSNEEKADDLFDNEDSRVDLFDKSDVVKTNKNKNKENVYKVPESDGLIAPKGLTNLGNTCYFNSVMQIIAQTHPLFTLLNERANDGFEWIAKGLNNVNGWSYIRQFDEQLNTSLPKCFSMTEQLIHFMRETRSPNSSKVITPSTLLKEVRKKWSQFSDGSQEDAHELLRCLLDSVRCDEVKRQRKGIMSALEIPNVYGTALNLDDDAKARCKSFSHYSSKTIIDFIFGGLMLSSITCEQCQNTSQIFEPFYDLSLSINEEKEVFNKKSNKKIKEKEDEEEDEEEEEEDKENKKMEEDYTNKDPKVLTTKERRLKRQQKKAARRLERQQKKGNLKSKQEDSEDEQNQQKEDHINEVKNSAENDIQDKKENENEKEISENENENKNENQRENRIENQRENQIENQSENEKDNEEVKENLCEDQKSNDLMQTESKEVENDVEHNDEDDEAEFFAPLSALFSQDNQNDYVINHYDEECEADIEDELESKEQLDSIFNNELNNSFNDLASTLDSLSISDREKIFLVNCDSLSQSRKTLINKTLLTLAPNQHSNGSNNYNLLNCLHEFTSPELLVGANKLCCDSCTKRNQGVKIYTNATKRMLIAIPPPILTLHLKRFEAEGSYRRARLTKINRFVQFPESFDLATYTSQIYNYLTMITRQPPANSIKYCLYGVVQHSGTLRSGHYTAFVKIRKENPNFRKLIIMEPFIPKVEQVLNQIENFQSEECFEVRPTETSSETSSSQSKWYHISDTSVSSSNLNAVLNAQAYILFYERIY